MKFIETQRTLIRNMEPADVPAISAFRNDADCARYQRWDDTSEAAVRTLTAGHAGDMFLSEKPEQHYAVSARDGALLGELSYFFNSDDNCVTLGITLAPEAQGKGLAFELMTAVTGAVREKYPAMDIVALIHPENVKSVRLFERLGFERECYAESVNSLVYTLYGK